MKLYPQCRFISEWSSCNLPADDLLGEALGSNTETWHSVTPVTVSVSVSEGELSAPGSSRLEGQSSLMQRQAMPIQTQGATQLLPF